MSAEVRKADTCDRSEPCTVQIVAIRCTHNSPSGIDIDLRLPALRAGCFYVECKVLCDLQGSALFQELKAASPFFLMAGPNVIESEKHCLKLARQIKSVTDALKLKLVFKASFDKANRTSATSFRGPGLEEGLRYLRQEVKLTSKDGESACSAVIGNIL